MGFSPTPDAKFNLAGALIGGASADRPHA